MQLNKIKLTNESTERFNTRAFRAGLTPNILCRIGFCLSLRDKIIPNPEKYPEEGREFNRYTLLGEWDDCYVALLQQWCLENLEGDYVIEDYFRAHLNRGVEYITKSGKSISAIADLTKKCQI